MCAELFLARTFECPSRVFLRSQGRYLDRLELLGVRRGSRALARTLAELRPPLLFQRRLMHAHVCLLRESCERRIAIRGRGSSGPFSLRDMQRRNRDIDSRRTRPVLGERSWFLLHGRVPGLLGLIAWELHICSLFP